MTIEEARGIARGFRVKGETMRVTIDFGDELLPALQRHLETGKPVQTYVRAALRFFNFLLIKEQEGEVKVGFGHKDRFATYNTEVSPNRYLENE